MWYWLLLNTCKLEFCILWTIGKLWQNAIPIGYNSRSFTGMGEADGRFGHTIGRPLTIRITEFFTVRLSVAIRILTAKIIRPSLQKKHMTKRISFCNKLFHGNNEWSIPWVIFSTCKQNFLQEIWKWKE